VKTPRELKSTALEKEGNKTQAIILQFLKQLSFA
jgi:hypothetical protein